MADSRLQGNRERRVVRRGLGYAGSAGAIVGLCLSYTPSLLPRHWLLQAVLSAIVMATGYAVGAVLGALTRAVWPGAPAVPRWGWWGLAAAGGVLVPVFLRLGAAWQAELRQLVDAPAMGWRPLPMVTTTAAVFALLLAVGRVLRLATRRLAETLGRFSPRPVASVAAVGLVAALSYGLGPGVGLPGVADLADRVATHADHALATEVPRPTSRYVSGGPGSFVDWKTLNRYGREFTAGAVPASDLARFRGGDPVRPPVRVYVGRDSAPTPAEQATLAVRELERTGGLHRSVVAVVVTTGTGWVNPAVAQALEYLHGGDTALVAMQYSYLPSWLAFMADRSAATEAAAVLIDTVRVRLDALPAQHRPTLAVYGESLGSHGIESAYGDLDKLLAATDAALLVGPPHSNPIWAELAEHRRSGSPVSGYHEGQVCFSTGAAAVPAGNGRPRVVYLQHASDPVVWWSPELLYRRPEWLGDRRAPDLTDDMHWFPVVTFWQVTVDLTLSTKAPSGHGHAYREGFADAWAALVAPPDWTQADTARLRSRLAALG